MAVFGTLLRAHAVLTRELGARLVAEHGLTLSDYEVLLRLSRAPDRRLRRVDLAAQVLLTPSGITRLLDGLEEAGLVERALCSSDRRVTYAVLTDEGLERLRAATAGHLEHLDEVLAARLDDDGVEQLGRLLEVILADAPSDACGSDGAAAATP